MSSFLEGLGLARATALQQYPRYPDSGYIRCVHGDDCPLCRASREANVEAERVRGEEYKKRCEKYMEEWRKRSEKK